MQVFEYAKIPFLVRKRIACSPDASTNEWFPPTGTLESLINFFPAFVEEDGENAFAEDEKNLPTPAAMTASTPTVPTLINPRRFIEKFTFVRPPVRYRKYEIHKTAYAKSLEKKYGLI